MSLLYKFWKFCQTQMQKHMNLGLQTLLGLMSLKNSGLIVRNTSSYIYATTCHYAGAFFMLYTDGNMILLPKILLFEFIDDQIQDVCNQVVSIVSRQACDIINNKTNDQSPVQSERTNCELCKLLLSTHKDHNTMLISDHRLESCCLIVVIQNSCKFPMFSSKWQARSVILIGPGVFSLVMHHPWRSHSQKTIATLKHKTIGLIQGLSMKSQRSN